MEQNSVLEWQIYGGEKPIIKFGFLIHFTYNLCSVLDDFPGYFVAWDSFLSYRPVWGKLGTSFDGAVIMPYGKGRWNQMQRGRNGVERRWIQQRVLALDPITHSLHACTSEIAGIVQEDLLWSGRLTAGKGNFNSISISKPTTLPSPTLPLNAACNFSA